MKLCSSLIAVFGLIICIVSTLIFQWFCFPSHVMHRLFSYFHYLSHYHIHFISHSFSIHDFMFILSFFCDFFVVKRSKLHILHEKCFSNKQSSLQLYWVSTEDYLRQMTTTVLFLTFPALKSVLYMFDLSTWSTRGVMILIQVQY